MPLDRDEVRRIAALAHLNLTEDETERFAAEMAAVLEFARDVQSLDTSGVAPTSHPLGVESVMRDDTPAPPLDRASAVGAAPDGSVETGLFRVPRVVTRDE
jgi:aspartyl-tRNA(Asn)/glutamyl-tRNA(Gln) amidotransferase subunit C